MVRLSSIFAALALLSAVTMSAANADNGVGTPTAAIPPASAPVLVATVAPPTQVSEPTPPPTAVPTDTGQITVSGESHPIRQMTQVPAVEPSPAPTPSQISQPYQPPASGPTRPVPTLTPAATAPVSQSNSTGSTIPASTQQTAGSSTIINFSTTPVSAQAPAQLQCQGRRWPVSAPFLSSPYSGWADINSFADHDSPDYSVDGKIVLANGITALAADGQESDFFPAYWSAALRQYVNYDGHNGYDFGISYQPVYAAAAGMVSYAGWNSSDPASGYGQMVLINHHNGYSTLYGHLSKLEVNTGDRVTAGEELGISGTTGNSTGPHLHFSVFHNCQVTDPYGWTGQGADPLKAFDGETSAYLWLPDHDPLVVNPPPAWPAFPIGLRLTVAVDTTLLHGRINRTLPPADRLLLLQLPAPGPHPLISGAAVAQTASRVLREWEDLRPYLADLKASGAVKSFKYLPALGAIWVRGTASAAQLEELPGVASLAGVQPQDIRNAEAGLAHAVLVQTAMQRAPSLWPVGFHSSINAWRPLTGVICGQPFVTGMAEPGQAVTIVLRRNGNIVARGTTTADPETGGFVALLIGRLAPEPPRAGDVLDMETGGRSTVTSVASLAVRLHGKKVTGAAPAGSTVQITIFNRNGGTERARVASARADGTFAVELPSGSEAGATAVASVVDGAGNQEAVASARPGMILLEGSNVVHGWTVGAHPILRVRRNGRILLSIAVRRAADGSFVTQLRHGRSPILLAPGDVVSLGSLRHRSSVTLSRLHGAHSEITVGGDLIAATSPLRLSVKERSPLLKMYLPGSNAARVELYSHAGSLLGAGVAESPRTGWIVTPIHDRLGRPVAISSEMRVVVMAPGASTDLVISPQKKP